MRYSVARSNCITIKKFIIDIYRLHDIIKYGQLCPIQRLPITRRPDPRRYEYRASPPSSFPGMGHPLLAGGIYVAGRTSPRSGPEGRTLHAAPLSGGGIDTLRRVVKPINAPCAGRARVDAMVTGRVAPIILLAVWG